MEHLHSRDVSSLSQEDLKLIADCTKGLILGSQVYKDINKLKMFDPQNLKDFEPINMIDSERLGGFKIEHLISLGHFTAAKQYTLIEVPVDSR